jgi:hypothetical protein
MRFRWPHFHSDPNWQLRGVHVYYKCICGAKRVRRAYNNLNGPVESGWPRLVNSHGMPRNDSGWQVR